MILAEFVALFLCGTFFGAAAYISIAQHPASMTTGIPFAAKFFPPMYGRAAPMQIAAALGGTLGGVVQWYVTDNVLWGIGAIFLIFVVPFTLIVMKPINDQLLNVDATRTDAETANLLNQWAPRHLIRSIASGLSFAVYLWASVSS